MEKTYSISYLCIPNKVTIMNKELKRKIEFILYTIYGLGYYPMIVYKIDNAKSIRFYINSKDKVGKEVFNDDGIIRKSLTNEEIKFCLDNIDNYEKYKRVGC